MLPNAAVAHAEHSPFASGFRKLQSAMLLRFRSVTVIVVLVAKAFAGLKLFAVCEPSCCTPRVALNLTAVLPLPNTSYEKPTRGLASFQFTTLLSPGNV